MPECVENGKMFTPRQCDEVDCWCVSESGREIPSTRSPRLVKTPPCDGMQITPLFWSTYKLNCFYMGLQAVKWPFPCVLCSQLLSAHLSLESLYPMVLFSVAMTVWLGKKDSVVRFPVTKVISMPCLRKRFCVTQWPGPGWMKLLWPTPAKVKFAHTHKHNLRKHAIVTFCLHLKKNTWNALALERVFFSGAQPLQTVQISTVLQLSLTEDQQSCSVQHSLLQASLLLNMRTAGLCSLQVSYLLISTHYKLCCSCPVSKMYICMLVCGLVIFWSVWLNLWWIVCLLGVHGPAGPLCLHHF